MSGRLLPAVLAIGLAARLWGVQFGLPYAYARPDETEVAGPAVAYLSGDLRPHFFNWPSLYGYLVAGAYAVYGGVLGSATGHASLADFANSRYQWFAPFLLIPRGLSVAAGVVTLWLVFRLARRTFDDATALVATWFLALAFLHVRDSHFGMADITMTALVVAATLTAARWHATGGWRLAIAAGLLAGLAGSTKYNGLAAVTTFGVAAALRLHGQPRETARSAGAFGLGLAAGFLGASPYILIDWSRFVADIGDVRQMIAFGHGGLDLGRGWWHYATIVLPAAVGPPAFLAGVAGLVVLLVTRARQAFAVLAFPLAYYAYAGQTTAVFARYILPVVPFLCITAAWFVVAVVRRALVGQSLTARRLAVAAAALVVVAPSAWAVFQLDRLLAVTDNRVVTARALAGLVTPDDVVYQSGSSYGRVPLGLEQGATPVEVAFDAETSAFSPRDPTWVIVQRSPLEMYSRVPATLEAALHDRYALVARFPTGDDGRTRRVFDQEDAFYVPMAGFDGLRRPGPAFDVYRRR